MSSSVNEPKAASAMVMVNGPVDVIRYDRRGLSNKKMETEANWTRGGAGAKPQGAKAARAEVKALLAL